MSEKNPLDPISRFLEWAATGNIVARTMFLVLVSSSLITALSLALVVGVFAILDSINS